MKNLFRFTVVGLISITTIYGCKNESDMNTRLKKIVARYEQQVKPLLREANIASWNASLTGKDQDYKRSEELQKQLAKMYCNKEDFTELSAIRESKQITDTLMKRVLEVLYLEYIQNQADSNKLIQEIKLKTEIEQKYSNFRAQFNNKQYSDNEIEEILSTSTNSKELEMAWTAHKNIGPVVATDLIALVKLRNEIARELGYSNYHQMRLKVNEQDPSEIENLFNELDSLTRNSFIEVKKEIDNFYVKRYKIKAEDLMPWHYQNRYFQEAPKIYEVNLNKYYAGKDIVSLTANYYKGIGLNIDNLISHSDLFEKPGKNQHAYCTDIDRQGDVRVLCNIRPSAGWMNTNLHEFGHANYSKYNDMALPFVLRDAACTFTTEAIAMLFGRQANNPRWMYDMKIINEKEQATIEADCFNTLRLEQLVFSRWAQVMYRFEKGMYEDPDQDLNKLWWTLVEKYQLLKCPANRNQPDWATKIHVALYPCYYHNYLMGELLASQLHYYITKNIIKSNNFRTQDYYNNPEVGKFLVENVFKPGKKYYWNTMIEKATGEKLTAKYYALQFVSKP